MRSMWAFVLVAVGASVAQGQAVVNGDFTLSVPTNGTGNGWTATNNDGAGGWRDIGGVQGGIFILNAGGQGNTDPALAQLLTDLTPGATYEITGEFASWHVNFAPPGGLSFRVLMDNEQIFLGDTGPSQVWRPFSGTFVATGPSMILELKAEVDGTDNDFAVDNIGITLVPAPFSALLLGAGSVVALCRRR